LRHKLELGERRSLASHYTLTTAPRPVKYRIMKLTLYIHETSFQNVVRMELPAFEELLSRALLSLVACAVLSLLKTECVYVKRSLLENSAALLFGIGLSLAININSQTPYCRLCTVFKLTMLPILTV